MRHRVRFKELSRTSSHRLSLRRSLAQSLFEHGEVTSTLRKVKEVRPFAEKLITLARKAQQGSLPARRRIMALLNDRSIIPADQLDKYTQLSDAGRHKVLRARSGRRHRTGQARGALSYTGQSVVHRLIHEVAPKFADRPGGYTRIIRLARRRVGDGGQQAILQLLGDETPPTGVSKPAKTARQRRVEARYAFAARALRGQTRKSPRKSGDKPATAREEKTSGDEETAVSDST